MFKRTRILGCKPADTSIDPHRKLEQMKLSSTVDEGWNQYLVGALISTSHSV